MLLSWRRKLVRRRSTKARAPACARHFHLCLEALEDRLAPSVTIHEFPIPTPGSNPIGITAGADGNVWFTEFSPFTATKVGRITSKGVMAEFSVPGAINRPQEIAAGRDGNLWFTEPNGNRIWRLTPGGLATSFATLTPNSQPQGIAAGPDGNVWFTEYFANKIGRITPGGNITEFSIPTSGSRPLRITAGADGNLWFTEYSSNKIGRITPAGTITEFSTPTISSQPEAMTAGPDGSVWFTELGGGAKIGRITPAGRITEFSISQNFNQPLGIAAGRDGNLWFTEYSTGQIGRMTPAGAVSEFFTPTPISGPTGITAGADGNIWFTEYTTNRIGQLLAPANVVTGPGPGSPPLVRVFDALTGALVRQFLAYDPRFTGGVRVAVGDINHTGVPAIITAPGPGGGPHIRVWDTHTGALIREFMAYDPGWIGGVYVAAGDVKGDGFADIVTGADAGGGPHVKVFSGKDNSVLYSFYAYAPTFRGGVRVAAGDVTGDGFADIITAAGPGGGPHVEVFSGRDGSRLQSFYALDPSFRGGVYVAAADVTGSGRAQITIGAGEGGEPWVIIHSGVGALPDRVFLAYDRAFRGGVRVAAIDVDGDGKADILTAAGPGGGPHVRVLDGSTFTELDGFFAYDPQFRGGVFLSAY